MYSPTRLRFDDTQVNALCAPFMYFDFSRGGAGSTMTEEALTRHHYQPWLAEAFPGTWLYCTLVVLQPSQQIVAHRDSPIPGVRHHLPLQVNPESWVFSSGAWQRLEVGQVYTMDPADWHGAVNWGPLQRVHLVIDVEDGHA